MKKSQQITVLIYIGISMIFLATSLKLFKLDPSSPCKIMINEAWDNGEKENMCTSVKMFVFVLFLAESIFMYQYIIKNYEKSNNKTMRLYGIIMASVVSIIAFISLIMNTPFFIRALPFFVTQFAACNLLVSYKC
jgi:hypothetical protein